MVRITSMLKASTLTFAVAASVVTFDQYARSEESVPVPGYEWGICGFGPTNCASKICIWFTDHCEYAPDVDSCNCFS